MTKWGHDEPAAQERRERIGAEIALRSVRNAEPHWHALEPVDGGRLAALELVKGHDQALLAALSDIRDYWQRNRKRSRIAAKVAKLAAAALAGSAPRTTT